MSEIFNIRFLYIPENVGEYGYGLHVASRAGCSAFAPHQAKPHSSIHFKFKLTPEIQNLEPRFYDIYEFETNTGILVCYNGDGIRRVRNRGQTLPLEVGIYNVSLVEREIDFVEVKSVSYQGARFAHRLMVVLGHMQQTDISVKCSQDFIQLAQLIPPRYIKGFKRCLTHGQCWGAGVLGCEDKTIQMLNAFAGTSLKAEHYRALFIDKLTDIPISHYILGPFHHKGPLPSWMMTPDNIPLCTALLQKELPESEVLGQLVDEEPPLDSELLTPLDVKKMVVRPSTRRGTVYLDCSHPWKAKHLTWARLIAHKVVLGICK